MHSLKELQALVQVEIETLEIKTTPADLYEPIRYSLSLNAKRIRPALVLLGTELFGGDVTQALKAAVGIELFHNFTLLHDDIMDNAPLRRNQPTVHTKWNSNVAILSGDAMFTQAFQQMMLVPDEVMRPVLDLFSATAIEVCEGQQLDMDFEKMLTIKIKDYLQMIGLKTAVLLAASLKTGAIISKTTKENAEHIYEYGKNLGIAFQLQDDILDVYADPDKFGKQIGGDIISNKKTYLLISALYNANIDQYEALVELLHNQKERFSPYEKVNRITAIYNEIGVKEMAQTAVNSYYTEALTHLEKIEISDVNKQVLYDFGEMLMKREL